MQRKREMERGIQSERERESAREREVQGKTENAALTCWSLMVVSREHLGFRV